MDSRLLERRITCPFCAEPMSILIDLSAGAQTYIEDCQVCCQPMQIAFETDGSDLLYLQIDRA